MHQHVRMTVEIEVCDHMYRALEQWTKARGRTPAQAVSLAARIGMVYMIADQLADPWPTIDVAAEPMQLAQQFENLEGWLHDVSPQPTPA